MTMKGDPAPQVMMDILDCLTRTMWQWREILLPRWWWISLTVLPVQYDNEGRSLLPRWWWISLTVLPVKYDNEGRSCSPSDDGCPGLSCSHCPESCINLKKTVNTNFTCSIENYFDSNATYIEFGTFLIYFEG